jgi:hypothetical protein
MVTACSLGGLRLCPRLSLRALGTSGFGTSRHSPIRPIGGRGLFPACARGPFGIRPGDQRRLRVFRTRGLHVSLRHLPMSFRLIGGTSLVFPNLMGNFTNTSLFVGHALFSLLPPCSILKPDSRRLCKTANIAQNDAMILPHDANPGRMGFSERTREGTSDKDKQKASDYGGAFASALAGESTLTCWRSIRFSASSLALDLKSEARTWRNSLNKSIIRQQAYPGSTLLPSIGRISEISTTKPENWRFGSERPAGTK